MRSFGFVVIAAALAACSPGGTGTSTASSSDSAAATSSVASVTTTTGADVIGAGSGHDACHGDLTSVDVAPLLGAGTITVSVDASNPAKCAFSAGNNTAVQITLARGADVQTTWDHVQQTHGGNMITVIGVGESGLRTADNTELMARKGALLCQIDVVGMSAITAHSSIHDGDGVNALLAALCAKVFEAEHA
jgi:hypothetical protein